MFGLALRKKHFPHDSRGKIGKYGDSLCLRPIGPEWQDFYHLHTFLTYLNPHLSCSFLWLVPMNCPSVSDPSFLLFFTLEPMPKQMSSSAEAKTTWRRHIYMPFQSCLSLPSWEKKLHCTRSWFLTNISERTIFKRQRSWGMETFLDPVFYLLTEFLDDRPEKEQLQVCMY